MPVSTRNQKFENLLAKVFLPGMLSDLRLRAPTSSASGVFAISSTNFGMSEA